MKRALVFLVCLLTFSTFLWAVNFLEKKVVKLGEIVPDFKLRDTAGKAHQLSGYLGKPVMIHFWSANCPFVMRYEERLQEIAEDFSKRGVVILAIDSNADESVKHIKEIAEKRKVNYPILIDPNNQVADQFGAITTPHVFIVDQEGKLAYEGAVDDQGYAEHNKVSQSYVRDALDAVLSGSPVPTPQTKSVGCSVKRVF